MTDQSRAVSPEKDVLAPQAPGWLRAAATGAGLDTLKIAAAVLMVVDHANHILFADRFFEAYLVGRMAFPLFCFAAASALLRMRADAGCYRQAALLFGLALVTEPVSWIAREYEVVNVLFTLSAAMAVAPWVMSLPAFLRAAAYSAAIVAAAWPGLWEFGLPGVLLPAALALCLKGRVFDGVAACLLAGVMNFSGYAGSFQAGADGQAIFLGIVAIVFFSTAAPAMLVAAVGSAFARPWRRRLLPRYALHVFYPLHLLALWGGNILM